LHPIDTNGALKLYFICAVQIPFLN